ncbi:MAG TPA: PQQ-binding-like beta-propeller repeat protein [Verrucomicrobiae bacterium]|nr:PQQ-binding-like beta-propeller repeat protein [Verrucomicrobiae bacterium]
MDSWTTIVSKVYACSTPLKPYGTNFAGNDMTGARDREVSDSELLAWRWRTDHSDDPTIDPNGSGTIVVLADAVGVTVERIDERGETVWTGRVGDADSASIVTEPRVAYVALYRRGLSGARLQALDVSTGRVLWDAQLEALGPIHHSKYANVVQVRRIAGSIVVYGKEAAGRYVEARAVSNGQLIGHRILGAA